MFKKRNKKTKLKAIHGPSAFDHRVISWVASEYVRHDRGMAWKVLALLSVAVSAVAGVYYGAWTFSLALVVFAVVYWLVNLEHPKNVETVISDIGVKVGFRKYSFTKIKSFWIIYEPPFVSTLNISVEGEFPAYITIQLGNQNPAEIRDLLIRKIPELEGKTESLSDIFLRLFKI